MSEEVVIPNSINKFYDYFEAKGFTNQQDEPIEKKYLDQEPFNHPEIQAAIARVWFLGKLSDTQVWLIQTNKWDRKTWRNIFIRKLKDTLDTFLLFFLPDELSKSDEIDHYSLTTIMFEGVTDIPIITPTNPLERVERFWNALEEDALEDVILFQAKASQLQHELIAKRLLPALKKGDTNAFIKELEERGLQIANSSIVIPRKNTPLKEAVLFVKLHEKISDLDNELESIRQTYRENRGVSPEWVIILEQNKISYFSGWKKEQFGEISLTRDDEFKKGILTKLISVINRRSSFNAETFANQFGTYSPLFIKAQKKMRAFLDQNYDDYKVLFEEWQRFFQAVYRTGDTDKNLFIKHSYLSLLIRITLMMRYLPEEDIEEEKIERVVNYFEDKGVSIFGNDFFRWATGVKEIRTDLFFALKNAIFDADDIFRTIYQQMVSPETRQALGEFYTPQELAHLMVEDTYQFGENVLDPACGSGTFLVEIIKRILNSKQSKNEKIKAIASLYGFDVNPIAVSVSKANILLQASELIQDEADLPIQIFLCNSLFPVERRQQCLDLQWGDSFIFKLHAIDKTITLNKAFFEKKNEKNFSKALRKLDALMLQDIQDKETYKSEVKRLLESKEFDWMEQEILDSTTYNTFKDDKANFLEREIESIKKYILKDNFLEMAKKFYELSKQKANHIWIYLLYNSLGVDQVRNEIDLCIGNPPWLVLNNIHSKEYKEKIKELANQFDIMPLAENVTHLEISALFLSACNEYYLKNHGRLLFVLSYGFVSGSNHDTTRKFTQLDNLEIWQFTEDLFNIHNLCLYAEKNTELERKPKELEVIVKIFDAEKNTKTNEINLTLRNKKTYVPYEIKEKKGKLLVKKLVDKKTLKKLLPRGKSPYIKRVYQGAAFSPRNLLFIDVIETKNNSLIIRPKNVRKSIGRWNFQAFKKTEIENDYIYSVAKSSELVPFVLLSTHKVFLPIERDSLDYNSSEIESLAKKHFHLINNLFKKHQKKGASVTDLREQINYRNKLATERQKSKIKVITNADGSLAKAAVLNTDIPILVDQTLYFISFDCLNEAYYYCTILNSSCISTDVQIRSSTGSKGSVRHLKMRPHEYKFPKFDPSNTLHREIVSFGKEMEPKVWNIANMVRKKEFKKLQRKSDNPSVSIDDVSYRPQTIRNRIYDKLESEFQELDQLVLKLLGVK
jgi:hypothetical protein